MAVHSFMSLGRERFTARKQQCNRKDRMERYIKNVCGINCYTAGRAARVVGAGGFTGVVGDGFASGGRVVVAMAYNAAASWRFQFSRLHHQDFAGRE